MGELREALEKDPAARRIFSAEWRYHAALWARLAAVPSMIPNQFKELSPEETEGPEEGRMEGKGEPSRPYRSGSSRRIHRPVRLFRGRLAPWLKKVGRSTWVVDPLDAKPASFLSDCPSGWWGGRERDGEMGGREEVRQTGQQGLPSRASS